MKNLLKASVAALTLASVSTSAFASSRQAAPDFAPAEKFALGYFLVKERAVAGYSQRIVQCPTVDKPEIVVESHALILAKAVPDYSRLYRIDGRARFLVKRSTDLTLNSDGTIKAINASAEGQGGAVLVAAAKLAAFAVPLLVGAPGVAAAAAATLKNFEPAKAHPVKPPQNTLCNERISGLVADRNAQAEYIARLETAFANGGLTAEEAAELGVQRDRLAALDGELTLSAPPVVIEAAADGVVRLAALDYKRWFDWIDSAAIAKLPGYHGVQVSWSANADARAALTRFATVKPGVEFAPGAVPEQAIYYRRPVPVTVSVRPCSKGVEGLPQPSSASANACVVDESAESQGLVTDMTAGFPQFSGLFRLPVGPGGLFGSQTAGIGFDGNGALISLKYGSESGAADMAASLDAVREAGTTIRDSKGDALARKAADLKSRTDIQAYEAALNK